MRKSIWDKRFPTLIGLFFLTVAAIGVSFVKVTSQGNIAATGPIVVEDVRVSNQHDSSLAVSFRTSEAVSSELHFGESLAKTAVIFDDRDAIGGKVGRYHTHHFTIDNLHPGEQYLFTLESGGKRFDNEGKGYTAKTAIAASLSGSPSSPVSVKGVVQSNGSKKGEDVLVFLHVDGATLLSAVTKAGGTFFIPLGEVLSTDLTSAYTFQGDEVLTLEIVTGQGMSTIVKVPFDKHEDVGEIVPGVDIDLRTSELPQSNFTADTFFTSEGGAGDSESVLTPRDGSFLVDPRPEIRGQGVPFQRIEVVLESELQQGEVFVGKNGTWLYQPDKALEPGKHTLTVRFYNGDTVSKVVEGTFEVMASGMQVVEDATPSATITPQPTLGVLSPTVAPLPTTATTIPTIALMSIGGCLLLAGFMAIRYLRG